MVPLRATSFFSLNPPDDLNSQWFSIAPFWFSLCCFLLAFQYCPIIQWHEHVFIATTIFINNTKTSNQTYEIVSVSSISVIIFFCLSLPLALFPLSHTLFICCVFILIDSCCCYCWPVRFLPQIFRKFCIHFTNVIN